MAIALPPLYQISAQQDDDPPSKTDRVFTPALQLVGQTGGGVLDVTLIDQVAYASFGPRLTIFDVSQPAEPLQLGQTPVLPQITRHIEVRDGYAWLANLGNGVQLIDVSDSAEPILLGNVAPFVGVATDLRLFNEYILIADRLALGVHVAAIQPDQTLQPIALIPTTGTLQDMVVADSILFLAQEQEGVAVIDLSRITVPHLVTTLETNTETADLVVENNRLYINRTNITPAVYDITDPAAPVPLHHSNSASHAISAIMVQNEIMYVGSNFSLTAWDYTNAQQPALLGSITLPENPFRIAVENGVAYLSNAGNGLSIVDMTNPEQPQPISNIDSTGRAMDVQLDTTLSAPKIVIRSNPGGPHIVDVANPQQPLANGALTLDFTPLDMELANGRAFFVSNTSLHIFDMAEGEELGSARIADFGRNGIAIREHYALCCLHT